jgi:hypothetical protein
MADFKLTLLKKNINSLKFYNVVNLDISTGQKGKESFYAAVYDSSNQLLKLSHKSYDDNINSANKKDESAYKEEACITSKKI